MDGLPRRGFVGIRLDLAAPTVDAVWPKSPADRAGVRAGDRVTQVGRQAIAQSEPVLSALAAAPAGTRLRLSFERGGAPLELTVDVAPWPAEIIEGARVEYDHVTVDGVRLRTIATHPDRSGPHTAVMVLPGLGCASQDYALPTAEPFEALVHGLAAQGLATLRVEKRGVGDSEGGPAALSDWRTEVAGYAAGLAAWRRDARIGAIVLFGHSVGGMVAPLIATGVAGVVAYGTWAGPWSRCMLASAARQSADVELERRRLADLFAVVGEAADTPNDWGRSARFFQQLEREDLAAAWRNVEAPVLLLHGADDQVVGPEDQRAIAEATSAERVVLSGLDHAMSEPTEVIDRVARFAQRISRRSRR